MYAEKNNNGRINIMDLERSDAIRIKDSLRRATLQCELTVEEKQRFENIIRKVQVECDKIDQSQRISPKTR